MNQVAILILTYLIFPKFVEQIFRVFREFVIYSICIYITYCLVINFCFVLHIFLKMGIDYIYK